MRYHRVTCPIGACANTRQARDRSRGIWVIMTNCGINAILRSNGVEQHTIHLGFRFQLCRWIPGCFHDEIHFECQHLAPLQGQQEYHCNNCSPNSGTSDGRTGHVGGEEKKNAVVRVPLETPMHELCNTRIFCIMYMDVVS